MVMIVVCRPRGQYGCGLWGAWFAGPWFVGSARLHKFELICVVAFALGSTLLGHRRNLFIASVI